MNPPDAHLPPQRFARRLLTGGSGLTLLDELMAEFPAISRHDVFLGAALAVSDLTTALLAAEAEIRHLRRKGLAREAG